MNAPTFAQDLLEMMTAWNTIVAAAREQFPTASEDELFRIASDAMSHTLGLS